MGSSDEDGQVQIQSRRRRPRTCSPVPRPREDFRASQSPCALGLATHFSFPTKMLRVVLWVSRAPEASAVRRMCGGAAPGHHGHFARVKVELFVSPHCFAGCVERSHKNLSFFKLRVFVDDITALVKGRNIEVAEMAKTK